MKRKTLNQRRPKRPRLSSRAASVLILTLIVVAMLTLGAMAFFERMFAERRAVRAYGRQQQTRQLAESGVEYLKAMLVQDPITLKDSGGLYANPNLFKGVLLVDDPVSAFRGRFTVIAPDITTDGLYGGIRYGLENESSRLNLNTVLLADNGSENGARKLLMTLPGMTETIADSILDWIDEDDEQRILGAERDYYSMLDPPYEPRNGPLASIEELLMVRDVTPALLFGADLDRNVAIDGMEQPLTAIENADNSTGLLNRGWAAYLTVDSAESNLRADGRPKIDLNSDNLQDLHSDLSEALGTDMANFIVAYRQGGAYDDENEESADKGESAGGIKLDLTQPGREKLTTILDLIGVKTRIAKQPAAGGQQGGGGGEDDGDGDGEGGGDENGGDENGGGGGGGQGGGNNNENSYTIVAAEFRDDPSAMESYLPKLMENCTINPAKSIPGRLNINQAPRLLLTGIPGLTSTMIDQIISNRDVTLGTVRPEQMYETWLLTEGIVELDVMKQLMALVTTSGNVYRAQVVGFFDAEGAADRLEVVLDATQNPPVVRRRWELRELGPGYSPETLGVPLEDLP
jgi:type II secretory pathway component PulK